MKDLIRYDFIRYFKDKLFILTFIIVMAISVFVPFLNFIIQFGMNKLSDGEVTNYYGIASSFWNLLAYAPSGLVLTVFMSIVAHRDISDGTIRNKIVMGKTREQIYFSNTIVFTVLFLGIIFISTIVGTLISTLLCEAILGIGWANTINVGYFFLAFIATLFSWIAVITLINLFAYSMDKVALAIIVPIIIYSTTSIMMAVLMLTLPNLHNDELANKIYYTIDAIDYFNCLGWQVTYANTPSGIMKSLMSSDGINMTFAPVLKIALPFLFCILNIFLGYFAIRNRDFK